MKQNLSGKQNFTGPGENSGNSFRPFPGDKIIYTALILLCLVITSAIAGIRPAAAAAAGEGTENNPWKVTTWSELCETLQPGGYIQLQKNVKYGEGAGAYARSNLEISGSVSVTLDLNGRTIDRGLENAQAENDGCVIKISYGTLKFEHYQQDGTPGVPKDIPDDLTLSLILKAKKDGKTIEASAVMDTIEPENRHSQAAFGFDEDLDLADGYDFSLNFAPKTVTGKPIYGDPPIPGNTYTLTVTSLSPVEGKEAEGYCLKIMMMWDNGTRRHPDDDIAIYALPEDEIGAYVQYQDGTKEYLLFHTYDICMDWLGSDELCSGYDRCFHKENPYQNPFVK